jgi:hypothetical protein
MKAIILFAACGFILTGCNSDGSVNWSEVGDVAAIGAAVAVVGAEVAVDEKHPAPLCPDRSHQEMRHHDGHDWAVCVDDRHWPTN